MTSDTQERTFWMTLDQLVASSGIRIDRPKGSHHPKYTEMVYPLDYGYLEESRSGDGSGIDVWLGSSGTRDLSAVLLAIDLCKHEVEIKLMLGCSQDEIQLALNFLNSHTMRTMLLLRPT
jgi:inorganic pyrophosphatase